MQKVQDLTQFRILCTGMGFFTYFQMEVAVMGLIKDLNDSLPTSSIFGPIRNLSCANGILPFCCKAVVHHRCKMGCQLISKHPFPNGGFSNRICRILWASYKVTMKIASEKVQFHYANSDLFIRSRGKLLIQDFFFIINVWRYSYRTSK